MLSQNKVVSLVAFHFVCYFENVKLKINFPQFHYKIFDGYPTSKGTKKSYLAKKKKDKSHATRLFNGILFLQLSYIIENEFLGVF